MAVEGMPAVSALINFDAAPISESFRLDDTVYGLLDGEYLLGAGDVWADVTPYLVGCSFRRGSSDSGEPVLRYEAGTGSAVLRNEDRRFDPTNFAGPYVVGGMTQVEPLRIFWWRASWAGVTYDLGKGYIDWQYGYDGPEKAEANLSFADAFSLLSTPQGTTAAQGAGELTGARVHRVLNTAAWPAGDRQIDAGTIPLQATTFGRDALAELQDVTDAELGELYMDGAGVVVFRGRGALLRDARSQVSQGVFGAAIGELPFVDVEIVYERPKATTVRATRAGGVEQVASVAARHPLGFSRTGLLMQTDQEAKAWATEVLDAAKLGALTFRSLTVDPRADPDRLFPQVLGRQIGDRITVRRRPPGGGDMIERDVLIVGIEHTYGRGTWLTKWALRSAIDYTPLVLNDPTYGLLDRGRLAF